MVDCDKSEGAEAAASVVPGQSQSHPVKPNQTSLIGLTGWGLKRLTESGDMSDAIGRPVPQQVRQIQQRGTGCRADIMSTGGHAGQQGAGIIKTQ